MLAFLLAFAAQQAFQIPSTGAVELAGEWRFRSGDSVGWAAPALSDADWSVVRVPGEWPAGTSGFAWYRARVTFEAIPYAPIGIRLRSAVAAYEVFLDGELIGAVGSFPPRYRARTAVPEVFAVPPAMLRAGDHVIAVRVYSAERIGGLTGAVELGALDELGSENRVRDYFLFGTALLLLGIGLSQAAFWMRRTEAREHLMIALLCAGLALFFVVWMPAVRIALAPWVFWYRPYLAFAAASAAAFAVAFRQLFEMDDDRLLGGLAFYHLALMPLALFVPTWDQLRVLGTFGLNPGLLALMVVSLWYGVRQALQGERDARIVLWGMLLLAVALFHDVFVAWGLINVTATFPWMVLAGSVAFVLSLVITTAQKLMDTEKAALYDRLTGLYRREVVVDALQREIRRASRTHQGIAVIMLDLDRFKQINDTLGHQAGDRVLAEVGRRLAEAGRAVDWLGRYGGEEFIAVLATTDADGAVLGAERLRQAVSALPIATGKTARTITLSAGIAAFDGSKDWPTTEQLIGAADAALYRAKAEGRDRVAQ